MLITTERLQYLISVAQTGSFSAAAKELGVSTAAVNKAIAHFEFDLELTLFERYSGKKPQLTLEGKRLYIRALDILPKLQSMEKQAQLMSLGIENKLTIALHAYAAYPEYLAVITQLTRKFPELDVEIIEAETLVDMNDRFDVLIAPTRHDNERGIHVRALDNINWKLVCAPSHPLASLKGEVTLEDLNDYHQLMLPEGFFTLPAYQEAMRYSAKVISVERFYQLKALVIEGTGFALYPYALAQPMIESGQMVTLEYDYGELDNLWPIDIIWQHGLGTAAKWFVEQLLGEELD
ncbi:LysR family transcriptional regulator [Vibrio agarivorans]|uniref:LysR family transcriptional regulator n=1 Tax=Vibrio agarivorans TaxID=153622 RepID=A0ABT7XYK2_9VIBR|nr:LysR family transcriptional regulator [Vibrio agarivorans]MDN2480846.1 LysR family transcriptional regulator [Vibrio agarivorans]